MKKMKKALSIILSCCMVFSLFAFTASAVSGNGTSYVEKTWDSPTNTRLQSLYDNSVTSANNGRVWNDKSVSGESLEFSDGSGSNINSSLLSVDEDSSNFLVSLSSVSQTYETATTVANQYNKANIVFVIDVSSSMTSNMLDNGQTRLVLLQNVAKGFVSTLANLGTNGFDINLSIVTYSGSATTVLDWKAVTDSTKSDINNVISNNLKNSCNLDASNTNAQAGIVLANYMFDKSTNGGVDGKCTSTPPTVNDSHSSNYIIYMSDGGPNRYYNSANYGIHSNVSVGGNVFAYATNNKSNISPIITSTDYKTLAAQKTLEAINDSRSINNITVFSLGLGQWFTTDASESGFPTAPYLLQLAASVGNGNIGLATACSYLGEDIPNYAMPGNNPSYPEITYANFTNKNTYAIQKSSGYNYYDTLDELKAGIDSTFGDYAARSLEGINNVDLDVLHTATNYYAGNTADTFTQSVTDIATSIQSLLENSITISTNPNTDGFISFTDKLGQYMKVDEIRCLYYKGAIYDGAVFADTFTGSIDVKSTDFKQFYDSFTNYVCAEYLSATSVENIVSSNIAGGSLYYNSDSDYSNIIKWYGAYDSSIDSYYYVGCYYNSDGSVASAPATATAVCESWITYAPVTTLVNTGNPTETNLMYINSVVATDIESGEQTVMFSVPSALEPESTVLINSSGVASLAEEVMPVSLVYSVSPMAADVDGDYSYLDNDNNTMTYYTNSWNQNYLDSGNTYVNFKPDTRNTFYYLQEDAKLYTYDATTSTYIEATDTSAALYYRETVHDNSGTSVNYFPYTDYFTNTSIYTDDDGIVTLSAGAFRVKGKTEYDVNKTANATSTSPFVCHMKYNETTADSDIYVVDDYLGNNGLLTVNVVGIDLTKVWNDSNNVNNTRPDNITVTVSKDGSEYFTEEISLQDCTAAVNANGDDTWYHRINGLPAGSTYTVSEEQLPFYKEPSVVQQDNSVMITNTVDDWFSDSIYVVLDFGLSTSIDFFAKSNKTEYENYDDLSIRMENSTLNYGTAYVDGFNIIYTPTTTLWNGYDTVNVMISCNGADVAANVKVMPATNVYFDDNFITFDNEWTRVGTTLDKTQNNDNYLYGYDDAYSLNGEIFDSLGSSMMATVSKDDIMSDASFTFSGTGFDLISRTGTDTGTIFLQVRNTATNKVLKTYIVDTYLAKETLYQLPVVHCTGLDYGTYSVTIKAYYDKIFDHHYGTAEEGSYNVYIDAIRTYYPIGSDESAYAEDVTNAYIESQELGSSYHQFRSSLINAETWNTSSTDVVNGVVYIADGTTAGKNDEWSASGFYLSNDGNTYESKGPKNEVYLTNGHGVAFHVNVGSFVHISAKSPNGSNVYLEVYDTEDNTWYRIAKIVTSTEMFYDVSEYIKNGDVIVKCTSEDQTAILSLCQIKTVTPSEVTDSPTSVSESLIENAYGAYGSEKVVDLTHVCSFDAVETIRNASCTEDGILRHSCICGKYYDEPIAHTGHMYVNGVCTLCSLEDPDYVPEENNTENTPEIVENSVEKNSILEIFEYIINLLKKIMKIFASSH